MNFGISAARGFPILEWKKFILGSPVQKVDAESPPEPYPSLVPNFRSNELTAKKFWRFRSGRFAFRCGAFWPSLHWREKY
jgi:hypothetical protein